MTPSERDDLIRRTAEAIAAPAPTVAKAGFDRILAELANEPDLAARLYEAMTAPIPRGPAWISLCGWFYGFAASARDRGVLPHLPFEVDGPACEVVVVAVDDADSGDQLLDLLETPKLVFYGIGAALFAGARARASLHALYTRSNPSVRPRVAVAIALVGDAADAAWFKQLPAHTYASAKRLHVALTGKKPEARIDAIAKIARSLPSEAFYGTLIGLCRVLEDETPDVVEHAALALRTESERRHAITAHHAVFLRFATRAIARGVTPKAREALDAVVKTIPRAPPLSASALVAQTLEPKVVEPRPALTADDELVRQILERPDDDSRRLVLADRLLERGDPRGEFIQIQCALGRGIEGAKGVAPTLTPHLESNDYFMAWNDRAFYTHLDPPNRADLEAREAALLRKHGREWLAPIRPFLRAWAWRRGFLDLAQGAAEKILDGIPAIVASHPTRIMLEKLDRAAIDRLERASLVGVRTLGAMGVTATSVRGFLGENLAHLDTLCFASSPLRDDGAIKLAEESQLRGLRRLVLPVVEMGDAGLQAIASSTILENLEELHVGDAHFSGPVLERLIENPTPPRLKTVFLGRQRLDILRS